MDDQRFDAMARTFAKGTSRRLILRLLIGGAFGGLLRLVQGPATRAADACPPGQSPCNGGCVPNCPPGFIFGPQCRCICPLGDNYVCPNPLHVVERCQCVCDVDCPGEQVLIDPDTCACGCPPGLNCPPNFVLDSLECECICPIDECPGEQVLDPDACSCACPDWLTCPPDSLLDPVSCECVCSIGACPDPFVLDPQGCACVCPLPPACLAPKAFDAGACVCVCPPELACTGGKVVDPETCRCVCPPGTSRCRRQCLPACPPSHVRDPGTCRCGCPPNLACPVGKVVDPATCGCACPARGPCRAGQVLDPATCACVCPSGTVLCRGRCVTACAAPKVLDVRTCRCVCPAGFDSCNGNPNDVCETNLATDPRHCGTCAVACGPSQICSNGRCVSNLYTPVGVQTGVPVSTLTGWTQCYVDTYGNNATTLAAIQAACPKAKLLLACRPTGALTLSVLAWAPRADVLFETGQGNTPHNANNVGWYFNNGWSWGFAPQGSVIKRASCDTKASSLDSAGGDGDKRLCWHTLAGNIGVGWRCGTADSLNGATYERLVFQAD